VEIFFAETDRPQMTTRRRRNACWINKVTKTHSEFVVLIVFPLQIWSHKRASMLCCTLIVYLVIYL
jgi:hypothetical protein